MITVQLKKWGNSLAVRFPLGVLSLINLQEDDEVEIRVDDNTLILSPVKKQKYQLQDLLALVTPENQHEEMNYGEAVGKEVW